MTPHDFIEAYLPYAQIAETTSGINAVAQLAQSAVETGWAKHIAGCNMFGVKADKSWKGAKLLVQTTELLDKPNIAFPVTISITPNGKGKFLYVVKDWFRAYSTPADSFKDHAKFFIDNPRYAGAMKVAGDWRLFLPAIAKAGYATGAGYSELLLTVARSIESHIESGK